MCPHDPCPTLFPCTTLFRSGAETKIVGSPQAVLADGDTGVSLDHVTLAPVTPAGSGQSVYGLREINGSAVTLMNDVITDRKSTRLNSSHRTISYAVSCLRKK